jgi:hypothetical protein
LQLSARREMKRRKMRPMQTRAAKNERLQSLPGLPETAPAHDYFGQILDSDGTVCGLSGPGVE